MEYRTLGKSDLEVSEIGFGCMSLEKDLLQNKALIEKAIQNGINFFDTADLYEKGENEARLGKVLKPYRKKIIIATKVGNEWNPNGEGWKWNPTKKYILKAIDKSLKRLQTDYIDLYQLHGGTTDDPVDEIIESFEKLKEKGKIRHYGIFSIRPNVIKRYVKSSDISSVMMQYSLLDRRPEETCLDLLKEHQIGAIARGVLSKGLLIHKPPEDYLDFGQDQINVIQDLLRQNFDSKTDLISAAIQFILKNKAISTAAIGIRTMDQLDTILKAHKFKNDTDQEIEAILPQIPILTY